MIRNAIRTKILAVALIGAPAMLADDAAGQQAWGAGRPAEALSEWRSAADAGDRRAMLALGRRYAQGLGVVQDYEETHKWLDLAASRGEAAAVEERDALAARMTPQQVATTSSAPVTQRSLPQGTAPAPTGSRIASSSREIRLRNSPTHSRGDPTTECEKQQVVGCGEGKVVPLKETAADGARNTGPALEAHCRFLLWLVPTVERFPRSQKFLLGDRTQATALDVLDSLVDATCARQRGPHLARANLGLGKLRFLMRLAHDLDHPDHRRYEHAARCLDETGRKVGAWRRTHRAQERTRPV